MRNAFTICLAWMVCAVSHGAWLRWDHNPEDQGVNGYYVLAGTNSRDYVFKKDVGNINGWLIPRLYIPLGKTNYFAVTAYNSEGESELSAEVFTNWAVMALPPITNVTLRVPSGKFYVERADTAAAWLSLNVITGPTNMSFPTSGTMGFFRFRPYFVSAANPKGGATKLMAMKQPTNKRKSKPVAVSAPIDLSGVNLDPSKAPR